MTSQEIRLLAIRLFGLYHGIQAVRVISLAIAFVTSRGMDSALYINWAVAGLIHGAVCFFCLARTEKIANWVFADFLASDSAPRKRQQPFSMAFFIALLALYFIVSSTGKVITGIVRDLTDNANAIPGATVNVFWVNGATLILGFLLLFGATISERLITGKAPLLEEASGTEFDQEHTHDD